MIDAKFEYHTMPVGEMELDLVEVPKQDKPGKHAVVHGGSMVRGIVIDGVSIQPSNRFWTSLYARFGLNKSFFKYFSPAEVLTRVSEVDPTGMVRICVEKTGTGDQRLLAATGLNKPVVVYDDLMELLENFELESGVSYHDGVVTSSHKPRLGSNPYQIAGDQFSNKFVLHCPIDGFGSPDVYLSLLRWVCSNGMVGYAKSFKTSLNLGAGGDSVRYMLTRTLDSFNSDEGYAALRGRMDTACRSWASLREQQQLYKLILSMQTDPKLQKTLPAPGSASTGELLVKSYENVTGRPHEIYHREPNLFSDKRQSSFPVECRVYDMMNFATELATHKVSEGNARRLQAWVGQMLSTEYDLEDSCDQFDQFRDMFLQQAVAEK